MRSMTLRTAFAPCSSQRWVATDVRAASAETRFISCSMPRRTHHSFHLTAKGTYLQSQWWRYGDRWIPGVLWPASLAELESSGCRVGAGDAAQRLRALVALPEDLDLISSSQSYVTPVPGDSVPSSINFLVILSQLK